MYESDTKPAAIEDDLEYHEEYLNVSDDQDDNFFKNQHDNSLKDEDDPQSDNQIHVCMYFKVSAVMGIILWNFCCSF